MPALSPTALATAWPSVMPTSSTVWWPSMCRSPLASMSRSIRPWRAIWSSMWSKKPMPVASFACAACRRGRRARGSASPWCCAGLRRCGAASQARFQGIDHQRVLVRRADGQAQAVGQQRVQAGDVLDQHAALPSCLRRRASRRARAPGSCWPRSGNGVTPGIARSAACSRSRSARMHGGLARELVGMLEREQRRLGIEHADVVRRAHLVDLVDQRRGARRGSPAARRPGRTCDSVRITSTCSCSRHALHPGARRERLVGLVEHHQAAACAPTAATMRSTMRVVEQVRGRVVRVGDVGDRRPVLARSRPASPPRRARSRPSAARRRSAGPAAWPTSRTSRSRAAARARWRPARRTPCEQRDQLVGAVAEHQLAAGRQARRSAVKRRDARRRCRLAG